MKKRLLSLILLLCMLLALFPAGAFAEEEPEDTEVAAQEAEPKETEPESEEAEASSGPVLIDDDCTIINPLYEGLVELPEQPMLFQSFLFADAGSEEPEWPESIEYTSSKQEAVSTLRRGLVNRDAEIEVNYSCVMDESAAGTLFANLFHEAYAHTGVGDEGDYIRWSYYQVKLKTGSYVCETSYYDENAAEGENIFCFTYVVTYYTTHEQELQVTAKLAEVYQELGLSSKSDIDKIDTIYRYIIARVSYDYTNLNDSTYTLKFTAYAALINRTAVCQGTAALFYRMALDNGLDTRLIAGTGNGSSHGWNIVGYNGVYYNMDPTWDGEYYQANGSIVLFMKNEADFKLHERWAEFDTADFNARYPMAQVSYSVNCSKGHNYVNHTCSVCGTKEKFTVAVSYVCEGSDTELTVSGAGSYEYGAEVTAAAERKTGFKFLGWYENETQVSSQYSFSFNAGAARSLTAKYVYTGVVSLTVSGPDGLVSVNGNVIGADFTGKFTATESVTLAYLGAAEDFVRWVSPTGRELSSSPEYTFQLNADTEIAAMDAEMLPGSGEGEGTVEFVSAYGQIVASEVWSTSDPSGCVMPEGPSKLGSSFKGWSVNGTDTADVQAVLELIAGGSKYVCLKPLYDESTKECTVTIIDGGSEATDTKQASPGTVVTVFAEEHEGLAFSHWEDGVGSILSWEADFSFTVSANIELKAVYAAAGEEITRFPATSITGVFASDRGNGYAVSFSQTYVVPEGYAVAEYGILFSSRAVYGAGNAGETMLKGAENVRFSANTQSGYQNGTYTLNINTAHIDKTFYARGYMRLIGPGGSVTEYYTPVCSASADDYI